jgi:V8-like Glu-specific endopeptidase
MPIQLPRARAAGALLAAALALAAAPNPASAAAAPNPAPRIVNPEGPARIPWQAALVRRNENGNLSLPLAVFCGATVRDATHVITAAHCVDDSDAAELGVVAGVVSREDPGSDGSWSPVSSITSHPGFDAAYRNDLAILTLEQPLPLDGAAITDLAVVPAGEDVVGDGAFISGWGDMDPFTEGGQQPDLLQFARIGVLPDAQCGNYGDGFVPSLMVCAGGSGPNGTIDTCQGDSGGPLARMSSASSADRLIGVVSFGRGCADPDYPGIYTKLSDDDLNARATDPNPPARLEPAAEPAIGGTTAVGQTLTCGGAQWTLPPQQQTVAWLSAFVDGAGEVSDVRAEGSGATLALGDALRGRVVTCIVRAVNAGGARELQADAVGPVTGPLTPPPPPPPPAGGGGGGGTPPGGGGSLPRTGQPPRANVPTPPPADIVPPTAEITRRACARRRCTLTIRATDLAGPIASATVSYQRLSGCPKGRRGKRCRAARQTAARRTADGVFRLLTPRLAPARWRFTVTATDAAGNASAAKRVVLTVKR